MGTFPVLFFLVPHILCLCASAGPSDSNSWRSLFTVNWNNTMNLKPLPKAELARRRKLLGSGYWSTNGDAIVDSAGNRVWFSGVNWQGFETSNCIVDGLYIPEGGTVGRSIKAHIDQMYLLGFNTIRLAFAGPCVQPDVYPAQSAIDFEVNSELNDKTALDVIDRIVTLARRKKMRVILDYHRVDMVGDVFKAEPGLWYNDQFSELYFLSTWKLLAQRYNKNPTVVGMDVFNEPHDDPGHEGPYWLPDGEKEEVNWRVACKKAADVIQTVNPGVLIFVQGLWCSQCWWGSNLMDVKKYPLNLKIPYKLVFSIHEYGPAVFNQPWFSASNYPENLESFWESRWGFVVDSGYAPIWVGEFGSLLNDAPTDVQEKESQWLRTFVSYIEKKQLVWSWFTWGPNSDDTGGILGNDYFTPAQSKLNYITVIKHPDFGPSQGKPFQNLTTRQPAPISSPPPPPGTPPSPPPPPDSIYDPFQLLSPPPAGAFTTASTTNKSSANRLLIVPPFSFLVLLTYLLFFANWQ